MLKKNVKIRSEKHLRYIASLDCLIDGDWNETVVGHHLLRAGGKGIGTKACDSLAIPLTDANHRDLHARGDEVAFLATNGYEYLEMLLWLKEINSNSPDKRIKEATAIDEAIELYKN